MREFGEKIEGVEYLARPGSYGVIIKNGLIGLIKSKRWGKYFLVGGGIDGDETESETLRREAFEEIEFESAILRKINTAVEYFYAEIDGRYIAKECHFYSVRLMNKTGNAENELLWIGENEIRQMSHRSHQWAIKQELRTATNKLLRFSQ
jgi:8-oxo-dGTP diphosphatase